MTHVPRRGLARHGAAALLCGALVLAATSCSGGSGSDGDDAEDTTTTIAASDDWVAAVEDPCTLVEADEIAAAFEVKEVALLPDPDPRTCSFLVEPNGTLTVALHQPQATAESANRTAGTREIPESEHTELVLLRPGVSIFAREGRALAQVTIRFASDTLSVTPRLVAQLDEVAAAVQGRLPDAPTPGPGLDNRDLCDLAPIEVLGEGFVAGEPTTTFGCAYVAEDGTIIQFGWKGPDAEVPAGSLILPGAGVDTEPWDDAGEGATWLGAATSETAGSGRGEVPIDPDHVLVVEVSSTGRSVADQQELATAVATSVQAEAGD